MGKSSPKAPDPVATAQAQAGMNRDTAITQQQLNMTNQYNPWGSVVYDRTGEDTFVDSQGNTVTTPKYSQTTSYTPEYQAILDQSTAAQGNLANLANTLSSNLNGVLGSTYTGSNLGQIQTNAGQSSDIGGNYNANFNGNLGSGYNANFNQGAGAGYNSSFGQNIGGSFTDQLGSNYNQNFSNKIGNGYNSNFSGDLGADYNTSANLAQSYAGADDFSADRDAYTNALLARNAGNRQSQEASLRTQLANKGIREGSAAWNQEMERLARQNTDEQYAAILAGGQEQSRMVDMARQAAQFGNDAQLAQLGFGNNASLTAGQYGQNAQQLSNAAKLNQAQFGSQQQQAQNAAAMNQFSAQNAAALQSAQYGSQQQQNQNAANMNEQQWLAALQGQQNAATMDQANFANNAQAQTNAAQTAATGFANQANAANASFNNQAINQQLGQDLAIRNQPVNEISALLSGSQVANPAQMSGATPQSSVGGVDYSGLVNNNYNQQVAAHNAQMGGVGGLFGSILGGIGSAGGIGAFFSDRRLKKNISLIGKTAGGTNVYSYNYIWGGPMQVGVMAQEVPHAAKMHSSGFLMVDYGKVI